MTASMPTLVVGALPEETRALRQRLDLRRDLHLSGVAAHAGRGPAGELIVATLGDGAERSGRALTSLLASVRPARVIGVGLAGGLSADLLRGALIIAAEVRREGATYLPNPALLRAAVRATAAPLAVLVAADRLQAASSAKVDLGQRAVGPGRPAVVDLESAVFAQLAAAHRVPWLALRVVSDAASESLPRWFEACQRADGSIRRGAVVARALLRPTRWPRLMALAVIARQASEVLADAVDALLREMTSPAPGAGEG